MATYILEVQTKRDTIKQGYATLEEAKKALSDLDLTSITGFAKTSDGTVILNRSEVVSAHVYERQGPVMAVRRS